MIKVALLDPYRRHEFYCACAEMRSLDVLSMIYSSSFIPQIFIMLLLYYYLYYYDVESTHVQYTSCSRSGQKTEWSGTVNEHRRVGVRVRGALTFDLTVFMELYVPF